MGWSCRPTHTPSLTSVDHTILDHVGDRKVHDLGVEHVVKEGFDLVIMGHKAGQDQVVTEQSKK